jgi:Ca-activated chloride channel family protein
MAGEISLQSVLNRTAFQAMSSPQKIYSLIHLRSTGQGSHLRMPVNLGLVLDRSGSMAGEKIKNLREAVKLVIGSLSEQDTLSIVLFDDNVDLLIPSQSVHNLPQLYAQVDRISDRGGTTISKGMRKGLEELRKGLNNQRVSRMLLLTDGETYGDDEICRQVAAECGQFGIAISALGLGEDWNMPLLEALAQNSQGYVDHLNTPETLLHEFQRTVKSMQSTSVRNTQLTLRSVTGVSPAAAWRVIPDISLLNTRALSDRDLQLFLGDLENSKGQSILVELIVQPRTAGTYRIGQVEVRYDVPFSGIANEQIRNDILLTLTDDSAQVGSINADVMNVVEKVSVFKLQTRALSEVQAGNIALATQQLRAAATRLLNLGEADLAQAAQQEAANLEQQGQMSAGGTKKLSYGTRKLTQRIEDM